MQIYQRSNGRIKKLDFNRMVEYISFVSAHIYDAHGKRIKLLFEDPDFDLIDSTEWFLICYKHLFIAKKENGNIKNIYIRSDADINEIKFLFKKSISDEIEESLYNEEAYNILINKEKNVRKTI